MGTRGLLLLSVLIGLFVHSEVHADETTPESTEISHNLSPAAQAVAMQNDSSFTISDSYSSIAQEAGIPARVYEIGYQGALKLRQLRDEKYAGRINEFLKDIDNEKVDLELFGGDKFVPTRLDGEICIRVSLKNYPKQVWYFYDLTLVAEDSKHKEKYEARQLMEKGNDTHSIGVFGASDPVDFFTNPNIKVKTTRLNQLSWNERGKKLFNAHYKKTPRADVIFSGIIGLIDIGVTTTVHMMVGWAVTGQMEINPYVAALNAAYIAFFAYFQSTWKSYVQSIPERQLAKETANSFFFRSIMALAAGKGVENFTPTSWDGIVGLGGIILGTLLNRSVKNEARGMYLVRERLGDFNSPETKNKKIRFWGREYDTGVSQYVASNTVSRIVLIIPSQGMIALGSMGNSFLTAFGVGMYALCGVIMHYRNSYLMTYRAENSLDEAEKMLAQYGPDHPEYLRKFATAKKELQELERLENSYVRKITQFALFPYFLGGKAFAWFNDFVLEQKVKPVFKSVCDIFRLQTFNVDGGQSQN